MIDSGAIKRAAAHIRAEALKYVDEHGYNVDGSEFAEFRADLYNVLTFDGNPATLEEVIRLCTERRRGENHDADLTGAHPNTLDYDNTVAEWVARQDDIIAERINAFIGFHDLTHSQAGAKT